MYELKRTKYAGVILFAILVIVFAGFLFNIKTADSVNSDMQSAFESIEKGDAEKAKVYTNSALNNWNKRLRILMILNSHNKTDEIDQSLHLAASGLYHNNTDIFITESNRAIILLRHLKDTEYPTIDNIL